MIRWPSTTFIRGLGLEIAKECCRLDWRMGGDSEKKRVCRDELATEDKYFVRACDVNGKANAP